MATNYPAGLDSLTNPAAGDALNSPSHSAQHANANDAIEAIETELGTTPSGSESTVAARFEVIEANDWVTAARIAANAIGSSELADSAVNTAALQDGAVTSEKIADGTITATDVAASTFAAFGTVGNLLTANQASPTTPGAFVNLYNCTEGPAGVYTATDTVTACAYDAATTPVTVGQTYTLLVTVTSASRRVRAAIDWLDSGGAQVGATLYGAYVGPGTTLALSVVGTAPAGATKARLYPFYTENAGSIGDTVTVSRVSFHAGASGQWAMPGVPIVGGSPIATNGAVHLSGTGTPEGVVTAAPGSTWLQTDSTTDVKGWLRWVKATGTGSTGWVAGADADTGWRNVSSLLTEDWTPSASAGLFKLRRFGPLVSLLGRLDRVTASDNRGDVSLLVQLPDAFAPQASYVAHSVAIGPLYIQGYLGNYGSWNVMHFHFPGASGTWLAGDMVTFDATWIASSNGGTWPTSLPGTAL